MFRWLLLAFVTIPLVELYLLIGVGQLIGFWPTVGLTLVTGVVGSAMARREGLRVLVEWRQAMDELRAPTEGLLSGVLVLLGGALLITPGVLTDVVGFSLMFPGVRRLLGRPIRHAVERHIEAGSIRVAGAPFGAGSDFAGGGFPQEGPMRRRPQSPGARRPLDHVVDTTGESVSDER